MRKPKSLCLRRYMALKRRSQRLQDDWAIFHVNAKLDRCLCLHEITRNEKKHNDNGYGKWWTTFLKVCVFCETVLEKRTEDGCL